jgi:ABC-2 type transport system ATP-binding protein
MSDVVISVSGFRKVYGDVVAVAGIDFEVRRGEIFGLLGPNGAGKTSTLECLEGLRAADGGSLQVAGIDPGGQFRRLRNLMGVQLQASALPSNIRLDEVMRLVCAYHNVAPRWDLLDRLELTEKRRVQYHQLSSGQQRRLAIALAVAHNPRVLFLDEPTAGLDVGSRVVLHDLLRELKAAGTTIILATHDMAEAERMSDRIAILLRGKIVATGTPLEITADGSGLSKITVRTDDSCLAKADVAFPAIDRQSFKDDYAIYFSGNVGATVSAIIAFVEAKGDRLIDLRVERPSLEERFLEITNRAIR